MRTEIENLDREIRMLIRRKERLKRIIDLKQEISEIEHGMVVKTMTNSFAVTKISGIVCDYYDISEVLILSRSKENYIAYPRQLVWYLAHKLLGVGWSELGRLFRKDHGTVLYGNRSVRNRVDTEKDFRETVKTLEKLCIDALKAAEKANENKPKQDART